jgi:hypothetical protein
MTSQLVAILLVIASTVMACLVSLTIERRRPPRDELRRAEVRRGRHGKSQLSERRRFPPLHY